MPVEDEMKGMFASTPLAEAVKPEAIEEFTPNELKFLEFGMELSYCRRIMKDNFMDDFLKKDNTPTAKFLASYIEYANKEELNRLTAPLTNTLKKQKEERLAQIEDAGIGVVEDGTIADYIERNGELQGAIDNLYKKVATLQGERDAAVEALTTINEECKEVNDKGVIAKIQESLDLRKNKLKWLYNFMGESMDFNEGYEVEPDDLECIKEIKMEVEKGE